MVNVSALPTHAYCLVFLVISLKILVSSTPYPTPNSPGTQNVPVRVMLSDPVGISGWVSIEKHPFLPNNYLFFQNVHRCSEGFQRQYKGPFLIPLFNNCPWVPFDSGGKVKGQQFWPSQHKCSGRTSAE